jgi:5-methylcytosine-specific restriction endonuclease McrA
MKATPDTKTVDALLQWRKANMLTSNPEYQRGEVWTLPQKKRLIDSVLRGYHIPLIYLHHIKTEVAGAKREDFEIIDGQQRINALYEFREGAFKLFDPAKDAEEARFPSFIEEQPCPWGSKTFDELDDELQQEFLATELSVVMIETSIANEARDLFIRLQAGMPLNSQEKRDAWPGNFTEFVLKVGGKPSVAKYPGNEFFSVVMKAKAHNRGDFRQLTAQMIMLLLAHRESGGERLCDINRDAIDAFYYKHLDFDPQSFEGKRFKEILTLLTQLLSDGKRPKVIKHEAIHLALLVDSLLDDYTRSWAKDFAGAFDRFKHEVALSKKSRYDDPPNEYWVKYGQLTRVNSDRADTIVRRHQFFAEKMYEWVSPQMKDPKRIFGALERELIYYFDKRQCQVCGADVVWSDHEIHHVGEHSKGGGTVIDNGALVHKHCHPKGSKATADFAATWETKRAQRRTGLRAQAETG